MIQNTKHRAFASAVKVVVVTLFLTTAALAVEKKVSRAALPAAVQKTVDEQAQGAAIRGYSMDIEKGKTTYEVELSVNGHGKDVEIAKDGSVLEVEEEVALDSLPAAAKDSLTKRAAGGKIVSVEALTRGGKVAAYEGHIAKGAKRNEILVTPDGVPTKEED